MNALKINEMSSHAKGELLPGPYMALIEMDDVGSGKLDHDSPRPRT